MESKKYSKIAISSILVFALITATAATTGIPTTSFENVLAQGENMTGMSQDQTSSGSGGGESTAFNPEEIIKKEARGLGDADLGEVQEVTGEFIVTQKGTVDKDVFYIPKNLVDHFDGSTIFFTVTEDEAKQYKRD
ncbi:MAG TPA: hypothetical protein VHJ38_04080 [Nitrososphaeraceae archaeon]|jgi:hypothetical protein|nr:hypothetical protein [Nitrososphaeraceae archaeon]